MENQTTQMKHYHGWNLFKSNFFSFLPNLKIPINKYSLAIIGIYILLLFSMSYRSPASLLEGISMSIFPIMVFVAWSDFFVTIISKKTPEPSKKDIFHQDLFLIFYGFYCGCMTHIVTEFNNIDVRGWWALALLYLFTSGFLFSIIFALVGMVAQKNYLY